jgi:hypothetical protein
LLIGEHAPETRCSRKKVSSWTEIISASNLFWSSFDDGSHLELSNNRHHNDDALV